MSTSEATLARLLELHPKLIDLELSRIERLLQRLGHPEKNLPPVIHIAGTNGKGSTLAFLKAMMEAADKQVHAYISPHLVHFHERIYLAGQDISEALLGQVLDRCETANQGEPITYFEITTAAALVAFEQQPADALLLEVGLGGRYDATNVIDRPALSIITPVDLDHAHFLGHDIGTIAKEKAGILKPGVTAIIGPQADAGRAAITAEAEAIGAPLKIFGQDWMCFEEHGRMVYQDDSGLLDLPLPNLIGRHQLVNAGTAIAALRALPDLFNNDAAIERGLQQVRWPARMQRLTQGPLVEMADDTMELWLDGGHNHHAAEALSQTLADMEDRAPRPLHLILGMMSGKDPEAYLTPFRGLAKHVTTLPVEGEDAHSAQALYEVARRIGFEADMATDPEDALRQILARREDQQRVLICGSLYLAGQILKANG
jgi:dihydrofolate synthase/folylpolyglutamate synthase